MACPFKDIFGKPREGPHSYRIFDVAVVDTVLTILLAWIIQKVFFQNISFLKVLVWTFIIGEVFHWYFCVDTKIIQMLKSFLSSVKSL
jgi:hypothetical protein